MRSLSKFIVVRFWVPQDGFWHSSAFKYWRHYSEAAEPETDLYCPLPYTDQCNSLFIAGHVTQYHITVPQREGREGEGVGSGQVRATIYMVTLTALTFMRPGLPWPWCRSAECPRRWRTARPGPWPMRREYKELWPIRRQHEWHQVAGNEMNCLPDTLLVW